MPDSVVVGMQACHDVMIGQHGWSVHEALPAYLWGKVDSHFIFSICHHQELNGQWIERLSYIFPDFLINCDPHPLTSSRTHDYRRRWYGAPGCACLDPRHLPSITLTSSNKIYPSHQSSQPSRQHARPRPNPFKPTQPEIQELVEVIITENQVEAHHGVLWSRQDNSYYSFKFGAYKPWHTRGIEVIKD